MHIYFSGIGGAGIGPLALIAHQAGYSVSGSDKTESQYTDYLQKQGIRLHIGQTEDAIAAEHASKPIDWLVMSSAIPLENPNHPELLFAQKNSIKVTKRDEMLNQILADKNLQMVAIAGTHGKTTTTAMVVWGCKQLKIPISYSVGAKIGFGEMGQFEPVSRYFVYECDEFDRNFLHFNPYISGITTVDWDHHDIYPTREDYKDAFRQFLKSSERFVIFDTDARYLGLTVQGSSVELSRTDRNLDAITLAGEHNRRNALVAAHLLQELSGAQMEDIIAVLGTFPGSQRRFEKLAENIYTDYAHTPEEISATLQLAKELNSDVAVVYEPLTNKRQHSMKDLYFDVFEPATVVYWAPTYLAREDPAQHVLTPNELIAGLSPRTRAEVVALDADLIATIRQLAANGTLVLCLAGGGGNSLDEFLRKNIKVQ